MKMFLNYLVQSHYVNNVAGVGCVCVEREGETSSASDRVMERKDQE